MEATGNRGGQPQDDNGANTRIILGFALGAFLFAAVLNLLVTSGASLTTWFLQRQDIPLLAAAVIIARVAATQWKPVTGPFAASRVQVALLCILLVLVGWIGRRLILSGYDLSRDEQMASFDAMIFATGKLVEPLDPFWRHHAEVLNTMFMYGATDRVAWVSGYLPVNSAIRALFDTVLTADLANPVLAAVGLVGLWRCVARIWPGDNEALAVALALYCASGQILINAMTSYAMTAHLALSLVWLALLLREDWRGDIGALAVGFLATGLHQPVPHPLYAAPLLLMVLRKSPRRGLFFFLGYCAIGLFWLWWPHYIGAMVEADAATAAQGGAGFLPRLMGALQMRGGPGLYEMAANLLRFVAWQHVLLLPLVIMAGSAIRRDRLADALAGGVALTIVAMFVILPYQGHGFGYRYMHGLIGSLILLAVYGWHNLQAAAPQWRTRLRNATILTALVILPLQGWFAHALYTPNARAHGDLMSVDADYMVVPPYSAPFAWDTVINPPALDRRPVLLIGAALGPDALTMLCAAKPAVAVAPSAIFRPIVDYFGLEPQESDKKIHDRTVAMLQDNGCRITPTQPAATSP